MGVLLLALFTCWRVASSQLAGTVTVETPPPVDVAYCTKARGCEIHRTNATLDANWRWVHTGSGYENCYTDAHWDSSHCPDPKSCAESCALEGVTAEQYVSNYGVSTIQGGLELKFVTDKNAGSRLYLTEAGGERYKLFKLKNREFSFDVDVSSLPCGLNGAVYFSEMDAAGGSGGSNEAGPKYGTGYCDAQCPHDVKFMAGGANILEWDSLAAHGKWGSCCAEMDIWEANREATAFTSHPCSIAGPQTCLDEEECGDGENRYKGVCDKDGCDFNSYRSGARDFFGKSSDFAVDSSRPFTIVTQWITDTGMDDGDLVEIRRIYKQDGQVIANSAVSTPGRELQDESITDEWCDAQKAAFGDPNEHRNKRGLKAMGEALNRGMVLVLSIWDDAATHMTWLDSSSGDGSQPGAVRGPCPRSSGAPEDLRAKHGDSSVKYTNFKFGELHSTYTVGPSVSQAEPTRGEPVPEVATQPAAPKPAHTAPALGLAAFSQCGGKTWKGSTLCQHGCTCIAWGELYSQCTPPAGTAMCGTETPAEPSPPRSLRSRRENYLLQRLGEVKRVARVSRSDRASHLTGDEL